MAVVKDLLDGWAGAIEPVIYATEGIERSVYTDALVDAESLVRPRFSVAGSIGAHLSDCYRVTPVSGNDSIGSANHTLSVGLVNLGTTAQTLTSGVQVARASRAARTIKCLFIGDSVTADAHYIARIKANAVAGGVTTITLLGTQSTTISAVAYAHEGHSGWSEATFSGFPSNTGPSPFYFGGAFNFATYRSTNSIAAPDYVGIMLGINDIFNYADSVSDATVASDAASSFARIDAWITSIRADTPGCIIGIHTLIPPAASQDAFGLGLGTTKNRLAYLRHRQIWYKTQISYFSGRTGSGVYVIPTGSALDCVRGFDVTTAAPFSGATASIDRQNNHVHPSGDGHKQIGDAVYAALKCIFA